MGDRAVQDYIDVNIHRERVAARIDEGIADHRALLARLFAKGSRDARAIDATVAGITDLREWRDRRAAQGRAR